MAKDKTTLKRDAYATVFSAATAGGTRGATRQAEEHVAKGGGLDPLVDPKGPSHLGPIRRSLPRFEKHGNYWILPMGLPMAEETLFDGTGSMGDNVDIALRVLLDSYAMLTGGKTPILGRYDPQIATGVFNDVDDLRYWNGNEPVLCRSQFEMGEKIPIQMTMMVPGRNGCGNGKEDSQFGIFGAAYLTDAAINRWGLKSYHFTVSDEPTVDRIDLGWLKRIFGEDVLDYVQQNGFNFDAKSIPSTAQAVADLQKRAHAFFLQVDNRSDVTEQWNDLYGDDHFVMLPSGTKYLHYVKAVIIGLTEGVLDLNSAKEFMMEHKASAKEAEAVIRAVAHIPLGAQMQAPNFANIPLAGAIFKEKTDLWPVDPSEVKLDEPSKDDDDKAPDWIN